MSDALPTKYEVTPEGTRFRVRRVPVFAVTSKIGEDGNVYNFDKAWLEAAAEYGNAQQALGYFAPVHLVHHGRVNAPERIGDAENYEVGEAEFLESIPVAVGEDGSPIFETKTVTRLVLFADLLLDDVAAIDKANAHPHRSVEIYDPRETRINSLALLGAEEPHLRFPNLRLDKVPTLALAAAPSGRGVIASWSKPLCFERTGMPPKKPTTEPVVKAEAVAAPVVAAEVGAAAAEDPAIKAPEAKKEDAKKDESDIPGWAAKHHAEVMASHGAMLAKLEQMSPSAEKPSQDKPASPLDVVKPVAMEGSSKRIAELEAQVAVLKDTSEVAQRQLGVAQSITTLEREGYAVGKQTRQLFESAAARGESLDTITAAVRANAPKLPKLPSEAVGHLELEAIDAPEVVKLAPVADSAERKEARGWWRAFQLTQQQGALQGMSFDRYVQINYRPHAANGKAR